MIWLLSAPAISIWLLLLLLYYWVQTKSCPRHQLCNPTRDLPIIILLEKPIASVPILFFPAGLAGKASPLRVWSVCEAPVLLPSVQVQRMRGSAVSSSRSRPRISAQRWIGGGRGKTNPPWNAFGGSGARLRLPGLMLGARESAQVLILACSWVWNPRHSFGTLFWVFKVNNKFSLPLLVDTAEMEPEFGHFPAFFAILFLIMKTWSYACLFNHLFLPPHCSTPFGNSGNQLCSLDCMALCSSAVDVWC